MAWGIGTTVDDAEAYEGALSLDVGAGPENEIDQVAPVETPRNNIEFYLDDIVKGSLKEAYLEDYEKQPSGFIGNLLGNTSGMLRDAYYRSSLPKTYEPLSANLKNPGFYGSMLGSLADMRLNALQSNLVGSNEGDLPGPEYTGPPIEINFQNWLNQQ